MDGVALIQKEIIGSINTQSSVDELLLQGILEIPCILKR